MGVARYSGMSMRSRATSDTWTTAYVEALTPFFPQLMQTLIKQSAGRASIGIVDPVFRTLNVNAVISQRVLGRWLAQGAFRLDGPPP